MSTIQYRVKPRGIAALIQYYALWETTSLEPRLQCKIPNELCILLPPLGQRYHQTTKIHQPQWSIHCSRPLLTFFFTFTFPFFQPLQLQLPTICIRIAALLIIILKVGPERREYFLSQLEEGKFRRGNQFQFVQR